MSLSGAVAELKRRRDEQGLSLATVSERSGLDTGLLSRLENGKILNPMLTTLWRYACAWRAGFPHRGPAVERDGLRRSDPRPLWGQTGSRVEVWRRRLCLIDRAPFLPPLIKLDLRGIMPPLSQGPDRSRRSGEQF